LEHRSLRRPLPHSREREVVGSDPDQSSSPADQFQEVVLMPLIRVELFDYRVNEETSEKLIAGLTDALCAATNEGLRDHTWVIVEGHDPKNWGVGGKPWPVGEMPPGP
jgi:phenylpyruvate tautomerase PptA (4-oxalocrotonate tautomerase family)